MQPNAYFSIYDFFIDCSTQCITPSKYRTQFNIYKYDFLCIRLNSTGVCAAKQLPSRWMGIIMNNFLCWYHRPLNFTYQPILVPTLLSSTPIYFFIVLALRHAWLKYCFKISERKCSTSANQVVSKVNRRWKQSFKHFVCDCIVPFFLHSTMWTPPVHLRFV